jgi:hypothetical protein
MEGPAAVGVQRRFAPLAWRVQSGALLTPPRASLCSRDNLHAAAATTCRCHRRHDGRDRRPAPRHDPHPPAAARLPRPLGRRRLARDGGRRGRARPAARHVLPAVHHVPPERGHLPGAARRRARAGGGGRAPGARRHVRRRHGRGRRPDAHLLAGRAAEDPDAAAGRRAGVGGLPRHAGNAAARAAGGALPWWVFARVVFSQLRLSCSRLEPTPAAYADHPRCWPALTHHPPTHTHTHTHTPLPGLFRGVGICLLRDTPSYGLYFVAYAAACSGLDALERRAAGAAGGAAATLAGPAAAAADGGGGSGGFAAEGGGSSGGGGGDGGGGGGSSSTVQFFAGGFAGMLAWLSVYPLDVGECLLQKHPCGARVPAALLQSASWLTIHPRRPTLPIASHCTPPPQSSPESRPTPPRHRPTPAPGSAPPRACGRRAGACLQRAWGRRWRGPSSSTQPSLLASRRAWA